MNLKNAFKAGLRDAKSSQPKKYRLNFARDVDTDEPGVLILNLPAGFRFYDELCHTRGFESRAELNDAVKWAVIPCDCPECQRYQGA